MKCRRSVPSLYHEGSSEQTSTVSNDGPSTLGMASHPRGPLPSLSSQESNPGMEVVIDCHAGEHLSLEYQGPEAHRLVSRK